MPTVTYNRRVSDEALRNLLQRIADHLNRNITVHSGDRGSLPRGSNRGSLHLQHRAADFHIQNMPDQEGFRLLRQDYNSVFDAAEEWEFIHHGRFTETEGEHLHIGRYGNNRRGNVRFKIEGRTQATSGNYATEIVAITP